MAFVMPAGTGRVVAASSARQLPMRATGAIPANSRRIALLCPGRTEYGPGTRAIVSLDPMERDILRAKRNASGVLDTPCPPNAGVYGLVDRYGLYVPIEAGRASRVIETVSTRLE